MILFQVSGSGHLCLLFKKSNFQFCSSSILSDRAEIETNQSEQQPINAYLYKFVIAALYIGIFSK